MSRERPSVNSDNSGSVTSQGHNFWKTHSFGRNGQHEKPAMSIKKAEDLEPEILNLTLKGARKSKETARDIWRGNKGKSSKKGDQTKGGGCQVKPV